MQIAIDGPAGAGKSTIAKNLSKKLGWIYIDTGAMYRATALYCINNNIDLNNQDKIENAVIEKVDITLVYENSSQIIFLNGINVSDEIRTQEISTATSLIAKYEGIRNYLVKMQQVLASKNDVIMDGRDIGSVVLPDATLKIYLTASNEERAKRRFQEQSEKGITQSFEEVLKELNSRDKQDSEREVSPLCKAEGAVEIDTTNLDIDQIVEEIINLLNRNR
ncbi:cytidylate kinase [Candidatus Epulonipiscium fishelsonii]|uniref:Cytidylate kinase n=1 Tax=Candidatus Epulonipiscium fishelsonii TaxID=77094 RepID=A0ACC8XAW6_9FIRM|nr:cytidylate kinase [Epulopiscium sp. SCG-B05WGA-EpuloA1]ONI39485.1 cytidylate kinase [Epulopiscium sp. SCG-B11WGA-EpuloA1]